MNKKTKYTLYAALTGGFGNGILNIVRQNKESPEHPIDWSRVLKATLKGAAVCGTGGFLVGAYVDYQNSLKAPINTDASLGSLVQTLRLCHHDKKYLALCEKADWLIANIRKQFGEVLKGEPFRFGSTENGTALREKHDIDVSISFKSDGFASILDMYEILEEYLKKLVGKNGIIRIRKQTVSIGVFFDLGFGREGKVDIVPIRITKRRGNKTSGYLHKTAPNLLANHSYQKTDTSLLSKEKLSHTQKDILIALKKWKKNENIPVSSHLLQNLIQDAYACNVNRIPRGLTRKMIMILSHIKEHIDSIHITSIENTNNVLTDISDTDKVTIKNACKKVIEDFQYQPNSIVGYFY